MTEYPVDLSGISIDSRTVQLGDLFIALSGDPGPRFGSIKNARDGHDFIQMAVDRGAGAIMCRSDFAIESPHIPVSDTLEGLWQLAGAARQRFHGQVVAITGSSGKTTMRGWLEQILASGGLPHASVGSYNNQWGVPLSLSRMPREADFGVFEVGTNHPGEIQPLSDLVQPDVALVLNVQPAHIGNFKNMQALTKEKLSIASGLQKSGILVVPHRLKDQTTHKNLLTFGLERQADVSGSWVDGRFTVSLPSSSVVLDVVWQSPERLKSVLASVAVLQALGIRIPDVVDLYSSLELPDGRGNHYQVAGVTVIDDSYNANPVSMKMALDHLRRTSNAGRRFALLGEMLELGDQTETAHAEIAEAARNLDQVLTFGPSFRPVKVGPHYSSIDDFDLSGFVSKLNPGDVILIKGSNKVFWVNSFVKRLIKSLESARPDQHR